MPSIPRQPNKAAPWGRMTSSERTTSPLTPPVLRWKTPRSRGFTVSVAHQLPPDLAGVVGAWDELPPAIRRTVLALVGAGSS